MSHITCSSCHAVNESNHEEQNKFLSGQDVGSRKCTRQAGSCSSSLAMFVGLSLILGAALEHHLWGKPGSAIVIQRSFLTVVLFAAFPFKRGAASASVAQSLSIFFQKRICSVQRTGCLLYDRFATKLGQAASSSAGTQPLLDSPERCTAKRRCIAPVN